MKNGLAIWHYPHRTVLENVAFFAENGFESVSIHGADMLAVCADENAGKELARLIRDNDLVLTVHAKLPDDHSSKCVLEYESFINAISAWQKAYGCLSILSFDVSQKIRDNIVPYIAYGLEKIPDCKIAVEDFGLNEKENSQIEHLKGNNRFGYLLDIGHMYIRLCGKNDSGYTLFTNSPTECPTSEQPAYREFLTAFRSKKFPIHEIHLHNNDGLRDMHYFLDDGTLDIKMIADVLKTIGFDGVLTIESAPGFVFPCAYPESDERILQTYKIWKECYGIDS